MPPRDREQKLYQHVLNSVTDDLASFSVSPRSSASPAPATDKNINNRYPSPPAPASAPSLVENHPQRAKSEAKSSPSMALPSQSNTPQSTPLLPAANPVEGNLHLRLLTSSSDTLHLTSLRNRHHESQPPPSTPRGPRGGVQGSRYSSPSARSNLAVQPTSTPANISLKKAAAKVVRPSIVHYAAPPARAPSASPMVAAQMATVPSPAMLAAASPSPATPIPTFMSSVPTVNEANVMDSLRARLDAKNVQLAGAKPDKEASLDAMFSRLMAASPSPSPRAPKKAESVASSKANAATDSKSGASEAKRTNKETTIATQAPGTGVDKDTVMGKNVGYRASQYKNDDVKETAETTAGSKNVSTKKSTAGEMSSADLTVARVEDLERQYLVKAMEFLFVLPDCVYRGAATKFHTVFTTDADTYGKVVENIKVKCQQAIVSYLSGLPANTSKLVEGLVKQIVISAAGNLIVLCTSLVGEDLLALQTLDDVQGLCTAIDSAIPLDVTKFIDNTKVEVVANTTVGSRGLEDPAENMSAWPTQETRDNVAGSRTCLLRGAGLSQVTTARQLLALVWGGRLEAVSLPEKGKDFALVKFMTAEACEKFFKDTSNGIHVPGSKHVVFVERQPGPNSINDVLQKCIEGDATRCVRALDAEEDWQDNALRRLACGQDKIKREIDQIKRGKTAQGRYYIEFRFTSVYNALSFRRELADQEDWEHCTVVYGPDPCELARGVHEDKDDSA